LRRPELALLLTHVEGVQEHAQGASCSDASLTPLRLASLLNESLPLEVDDGGKVNQPLIIVDLLIRKVELVIQVLVCLWLGPPSRLEIILRRSLRSHCHVHGLGACVLYRGH